jgi:hypothetical protein
LGHSPLDQLGLRQIHPPDKRKLETFFASRRIYLSKGAAGHPVGELFLVASLSQSVKPNAQIRPRETLNADS